MDKRERAEQYIDWLKRDKSSQSVQRVIDSLNHLIYSDSKKPITKEYKLAIIAEMQKMVPKYEPIFEHADNQSILLLIQTVKDKIESDKGEET